MELFLKYMVVGLSIALPIGAISIEMMKQGVKNGFVHGWAVGLGGMTVDFILIVLLYFGFTQVLELPIVQIPLWLIGAIFLFIVGLDSIKQAKKDIIVDGDQSTSSFWKTYRNGLFVAVSPGNLLFWVSVFGAILTSPNVHSQEGTFLVAASGILFGILLHDIVLCMIVATSRKWMNDRVKQWVSILAGMILIGLACAFVYEFYRLATAYI